MARQIPVMVHKRLLMVTKNGEFHKNSDIPIFINADPGSILVGDQREFVRSWQTFIKYG